MKVPSAATFTLCPVQRVLAKRYAERDVTDVEIYVRDAVRGLAPATPAEEAALVARGIFLVRRIARALPPEASLQEALREHLAEGLSALADTDPSIGPAPGTPTRRAA